MGLVLFLLGTVIVCVYGVGVGDADGGLWADLDLMFTTWTKKNH